MIVKAVRERYPEIKIVGTAGPDKDGWDFERGWAASRREGLDIVDEHYYCSPKFFLDNMHRYDSYPRQGPKVYLGEYASWGSTMYNAAVEAAYLTSLERNGDVVEFASYAPLLARIGHTQWEPDLIYFDGRGVYPTANYYVQQLFGQNRGCRYVSGVCTPPAGVAVSCVETKSKAVIVKIANWSGKAQTVGLNLSGLIRGKRKATVTTLEGGKDDKNTREQPDRVTPVTKTATATPRMSWQAGPYSVTAIRIDKPGSACPAVW